MTSMRQKHVRIEEKNTHTLRNLPKKYLMMLILTFGFCLTYGLSYLYFRQNNVITHYYTTGNGHSVETRMPDGPMIFGLIIANGTSGEDLLEQIILRVEMINTVYYPFRKMEEFYWWL